MGLAPLIIYFHPTWNLEKVLGNQSLTILKLLPHIGFIIIGYLGFRLNQTRVLFTALGFWLLYISPMDSKTYFEVMSISLPITLVSLFAFKESPFGGNKTLFRLLIALLPAASLSYLAISDMTMYKLFVDFKLMGWSSQIPEPAALSLLILSVFTLFYNDAKVYNFLIASTLAMITFYLWIHMSLDIQNNFSANTISAYKIMAFSLTSIVMLHSIYQMYWQRVYIDELTSLPNRRALDEKISNLDGQYSIAMIDIDHFKKFNDTYGHDQGDDVLKLVSKVLASVLGDKVYRYGGEEFAAIFQGVSAKEAKVEAEKARSDLAKIRFIIRTQKGKDRKVENRGKVKNTKSVKVTISIGLSNFSKHADCPEKVIKRADSALYKAKKNGRNCVVIAA